MGASEDLVHCPTCNAEYRPGVSICVDDGSLLVAGPAEADDGEAHDGGEASEDDPARGTIEVVRIEAPAEGIDTEKATPSDLFEHEEHPDRLRLAVMAKEDAPDLVDTLERESIGARLGAETPDGGIEVIVHDTRLADAQAVLVEFTGDPSLVDDVELDPAGDDGLDRGDMLRVVDGRAEDAEAAAQRVSGAGIDVRLELSTRDDGSLRGSLWVAPEDLDRARDELGIMR